MTDPRQYIKEALERAERTTEGADREARAGVSQHDRPGYCGLAGRPEA